MRADIRSLWHNAALVYVRARTYSFEITRDSVRKYGCIIFFIVLPFVRKYKRIHWLSIHRRYFQSLRLTCSLGLEVVCCHPRNTSTAPAVRVTRKRVPPSAHTVEFYSLHRLIMILTKEGIMTTTVSITGIVNASLIQWFFYCLLYYTIDLIEKFFRIWR